MTTSNSSATYYEILTYTLGSEEYGIDILKVREIRSYEQTTHIANAPKFIKGVINLRGIIVPIVDLRIRFGIGESIYNEYTVVIILNLSDRIIGIVVDGVSDVLSLNDTDVKPKPQFASAIETDHIVGIAAVGERMIILVDIESLIRSPDMALVDELNS